MDAICGSNSSYAITQEGQVSICIPKFVSLFVSILFPNHNLCFFFSSLLSLNSFFSPHSLLSFLPSFSSSLLSFFFSALLFLHFFPLSLSLHSSIVTSPPFLLPSTFYLLVIYIAFPSLTTLHFRFIVGATMAVGSWQLEAVQATTHYHNRLSCKQLLLQYVSVTLEKFS